MRLKQSLFPLLLTSTMLLLSACQSNAQRPHTSAQPQPLLHAYDFQIINAKTQQTVNIPQLAQQLQSFDVVFIGEFHGNHASHLLEMQLIQALHKLRSEQVLSLEMFNRDQQPLLDRYLDSEIGEVYFVKNAPAWNNYIASYRPIVEYAKQHFIPVVASNAAANIVRCIGREGTDYQAKLSAEESNLIAKKPFTDQEDYRKRYMEFLEEARKIDETAKERSFLAQLTRDNTMAESILLAKEDDIEAQVIHLNGSFHSDFFLGTVTALKQLNPSLKIAVVSPIEVEDRNLPSFDKEDLNRGDFIYLIQALPEQYQDASYRRKVHQSMFSKAREKTCKP